VRAPGLLFTDLVVLFDERPAGPFGPTHDEGTVSKARVRLGARNVRSATGQVVIARGTVALPDTIAPGATIMHADIRYRVIQVEPHRPPVGGPGGDLTAWWEATIQ
jgi:hypothetical protein